MPPNTATLRVGPYFLSLLLVLVALFGLVFLPGQRHTPKLGLDLEGGATVTLKAQTTNGKTPSQSAMRVARQILEQRVNGKGVSAAQVFQQGPDEIVISVPGANSQQIAKVGQAAKLNYRPLIVANVPNTSTVTPTTTPSGSGTSATPSSGATATGTGTVTSTSAPKAATTAAKTSAKVTTSPNGLLDAKDAPTTSKSPAAKTTAPKTTAATTPTPTAAATAAKLSVDPFKNLGFTLPTTDTAFAALTSEQQAALTTALGNFDCNTKPTDNPALPLAACDVTTGNTPAASKYLLGPVIVAGTEISSANAVAPSTGTGGSPSWTVSINLKDKGQTEWTKFTGAHHDANTSGSDTPTTCSATTVPCSDFVAFTLDGAVIAAPVTEGTINGTTQVSGNFTESFAKDLADDLKYGALPLNFNQLTAQDISATLGTSQLKAGLLAGGIGLLLVVIYSFLYYRGLGFVTVFSLIVSGGLTYAALVILGREIGFTLTLAGIAGFIVAVGITADSFVVLFERLKDEVHNGRSIRVAVPRAWTRARRTILSADTVSFLAAAVLYYFTVGDVRGFAFTLGLSTLLDIVVVFLFTHPLVSLLSRSRAFGSPRFTGLNSVREGGIAPSPEGHVRPARSQTARGSSATRASAVALLERDEELDDVDLLDDSEDDVDDVVVAPVASAPATAEEPVGDSGAPRRSRVVPRSAPAAEIGADAAERAAARRGRQVRPSKPVVEEPVDVEIDDDTYGEIDEESSVSASADVDAGASDAIAEDVVPDAEPAAEPEVVPEVLAKAAPEPGSSRNPAPTRTSAPTTAAERAAARRRGGRVAPARPIKVTPPEPVDDPVEPEPVEPEPVEPEPVEPEPVEPEPVEPVVVDTPQPATVAAPEPEPDATGHEPEPAQTSEPAGESARRITTAADRAAARRARIRARSGSPNTETIDTDTDTDPGSEEES